MEHFKQANCRVLAKAFIKFIEPHKQTRHPYNGGGDRDSEKTKPGWWPPDVIHKEPDHLGKERKVYCAVFSRCFVFLVLILAIIDRMKLLLHIICKLGEYDITADKLMQVVSGTKQSLKDPSHIEMIYEILRVRKMEERFERGEVGMY